MDPIPLLFSFHPTNQDHPILDRSFLVACFPMGWGCTLPIHRNGAFPGKVDACRKAWNNQTHHPTTNRPRCQIQDERGSDKGGTEAYKCP